MTIDGPPAHEANGLSIGELVRWLDRRCVKHAKNGELKESKSVAEMSQAIEVAYWLYWQNKDSH